MITIIDSFRHGEEHAPFNAAFVEVITKCYPYEKIKVIFQKDHLAVVGNILKQNSANETNRNYCAIKGIDSKQNTYKLLLSYIIATFQDVRLLLVNRSKLSFFTSANPLSLPFIKLISILLGKKIYVVTHGELEYLNRENDATLKFQTRLLRKWYRLIFWKFLSKYFYYILLGSSIKNNLKSLNNPNYNEANFIVIDHPYFYPKKEEVRNFSIPLKLGTIGHAAVIKGSHKIFELASMKKVEIHDKKIEFKIIGHISSCMFEFQNNLVETPSNKHFIPRAEFEQKVSELHYIVFFYPASMYEFIASGAFFDAIKFGKPIIALRNSFFESYFNRYGELGFLANSLKEVCEYIAHVTPTVYQEQLNNLERAKLDLSIEKISERLKSQLICN